MTVPTATTQPGERTSVKRHLWQLDIVRMVTFFCVVSVHVLMYTAHGVTANAMVQLLHFTRETFFALTAFVLCYTQRGRILSPRKFWSRRFALVLPAYICWNVLYSIATEIKTGHGPAAFAGNLLDNLATGYWHLYFVFVMMQLYVLFPLLWWLIRVTRGHHVVVLIASVLLELVLMVGLQHNWPSGGDFGDLWRMCRSNRLILPYQLYIVAGALAAAHFEQFHGLVRRHSRLVFAAVGLAAAATLAVYFAGVQSGDTPSSAATIYQPVMVLWNPAIAVGLYLLGCLWSERRGRGEALVRRASDASFGVYLVHPMVLFYVLPAIDLTGARHAFAEPWDTIAALALTIGLAAAFTGLALHTRLARVLTGRSRIVTTRGHGQGEGKPTRWTRSVRTRAQS